MSGIQSSRGERRSIVLRDLSMIGNLIGFLVLIALIVRGHRARLEAKRTG
jgi:hypothetical protein